MLEEVMLFNSSFLFTYFMDLSLPYIMIIVTMMVMLVLPHELWAFVKGTSWVNLSSQKS